jgi:hypothetical protein
MLQPSKTNKLIKYTAYIIVILSALIGLFFIVSSDLEFIYRLGIGFIIFMNGAFGALFLFAISEALSRFQEIEYNTERTYKRLERNDIDQRKKASS